MSVFFSNLSTNDSSLQKENRNSTDPAGPPNIYLFCLTSLMTLAALAGSIYSLVSLLKMQNRTVVSTLVASWSGDDLMSVLSVTIFLFLQWPKEAPDHFQPLCTTSALLYLCQGLSSNLKATLLVSYNFRTMRGAAGSGPAPGGAGRALGAALAVWAVSLLLASPPLGGWGAFVRTPWGCLADRSSSYVLLPFAVYSAAFALLAGLSVPLTHQLLCSEEPPRLRANYRAMPRGACTPGTPPTAGGGLARSPDGAAGPALRGAGTRPPSSAAALGPRPGGGSRGAVHGPRSLAVSAAQRRFSFVLALAKVVLWLPMMVKARSPVRGVCAGRCAWAPASPRHAPLGPPRDASPVQPRAGRRAARGSGWLPTESWLLKFPFQNWAGGRGALWAGDLVSLDPSWPKVFSSLLATSGSVQKRRQGVKGAFFPNLLSSPSLRSIPAR